MRRDFRAGLLVVLDTAVLLGALRLSVAAWLNWRVTPHGAQPHWTELWVFNGWMPPAVLLIAGWLLLLRQQGYYDPSRTFTAIQSAGELSWAAFGVLGLAVLTEFLLPHAFFSRSLLVAFLGFGFVGLGIVRWIQMRLFYRWIAGGERPAVLVVGTGEDATTMDVHLSRGGRGLFHVVGFLGDREDSAVERGRILGGLNDLRAVVNAHQVETVVLATRGMGREAALSVATTCDRMGLAVFQVPLTWGVAAPRIGLGRMGDLQLVDLTAMSYPSVAETTKRAMDLVVVLVGGALLSPLLLAIALGVALDGGWPVIYAGRRIGRGGRAFPFYKFRSMRTGADQERDRLADQNEADGVLFKIKDDPRTTAVGRILRRWSLDELPQLWNVARGDMNLVGPRPLPVEDLEGLEDDPEMAYWFDLRHHVRPGITGLWQVRGRANQGTEEMVQLDLFYVQQWSIWLDLKILALTLPAVLRGRGAS